MKSLYVIGTAGSGKTALCVALALRLMEEGHKVAYFKPIGNVGGTVRREDEDAVLMKELLKTSAPLDAVVPFTTSPSYLTRYERVQGGLAHILDCFRTVTQGADVAIVEGTTSPEMMLSLGLDAVTVAKAVGASVMTVGKVQDDYALDRLLLVNSYVQVSGLNLVGTVLNSVPKPLLDKVKGVCVPIMEDRGFRVLGVIPARTELTAPTVQEIWDILGGEVLVGQDQLSRPVEDVVIGAMTQESALTYFRRSFNKAVITGGDRADIALAALETSTSVLVLTGGLYPDVKVLACAEQKQVPVLLVPQDTYSAIERLHYVTRKIKPHDVQGLKVARESFDQFCEYKAIKEGMLV